MKEARDANELAIRNETDRPLVFVVENRNWAKDALTGERVIAMPAFRRLCPEQLLRPGDNAEIGWIAIMFTDLKGSTELYDALGDAPAYNLVRDHFSFLSDRVQRNHGFVVKTVGDAVMAAFSRPDDAVRAALAIQDDVASFNTTRGGGATATPIVLKLGLHAGPCISVTTADVLDYFGATVNIAARLEHQCHGGEVVVSEAVAQDAEAAGALADRTQSIDREHGLIRRWDATDAAAYEGARLREGLLDKTNTASAVWADTAYRSKANEAFLERNGFVSRIHRKKPPRRPMPETMRRANALKSKVRSGVEHVFAVQKDKMDLFIRTVGIARARLKIGMANLVYNFRRLVYLDRLADA